VFQAGLPVSLATYLGLISAAADHGMSRAGVASHQSDAEQQRAEWLKALRPAAQARNVRLTIKLPCASDWEACR